MMTRIRGIHMGSRLLLATGLVCLISSAANAAPQNTATKQDQAQPQPLIYSIKGPELFRAYCATCHGLNAQGGGPVASVLKVQVPNLTVLTKNNKGQFPTEHVRKMILGDEVLPSHGSREMPVWGPIFHQVERDQDFGNVRVENLIKYLQSIQKN